MFLLLYRELSLQISGDELIKTMLNWIILCNSGLKSTFSFFNWKNSPGKLVLVVRIIDSNSQRKRIV